MSLRLYLVQHGDALPEEADPERPLSPRGDRELRCLAGFLAAAGLQARRVVHSGKLRARQSAERLAAALAPAGVPEALPGLAPKDPVEPLAAQLAQWREDTVVVGHLPFLGRLAGLLLAADPERPVVEFRPGAVACLERDAEGAWRLAWMVRPELLGC